MVRYIFSREDRSLTVSIIYCRQDYSNPRLWLCPLKTMTLS